MSLIHWLYPTQNGSADGRRIRSEGFIKDTWIGAKRQSHLRTHCEGNEFAYGAVEDRLFAPRKVIPVRDDMDPVVPARHVNDEQSPRFFLGKLPPLYCALGRGFPRIATFRHTRSIQ